MFQCPEGHCLHCYLNGGNIYVLRLTGFSAPKGIVFIATGIMCVNRRSLSMFQCPEGHCLHCYVAIISGSVLLYYKFQCPEGHCLHCYTLAAKLAASFYYSFPFQCPEGHCLHCYLPLRSGR